MEEVTAAPEYHTFQTDTVGNHVRMVCDAIKELDQKLETAACLFADDRDCWKAVAPIKTLDTLGIDPYWLLSDGQMSLDHAVHCTEDLLRLCRDTRKRSQVWLNCWGIPAGTEEEIYHGGKKLAEVGCDSFYAWSFKGGLGTSEQCADAGKSWKYLSKLYRELKASF